MHKIQKDFLWSQCCLFVGLIACIILRPRGLGANNGISYYGTHLNTLPFYVTALSGSTLIGFQTSQKLMIDKYKNFKIFFEALFFLALALILFPYNFNNLYSLIHQSIGTIIFLLQGIFSLYIIMKIKRDIVNIILFVLEIIGGLIAAYYLLPAQGFLIQGQILFQLAFGIIMIKNSIYLTNRTQVNNSF